MAAVSASSATEMTSIVLPPDVEAGEGTLATTSALTKLLPPEPEINKGFLKPIPETTVMERVAGTVACGAVVTALVAMIIEQSALVILGGILSSIVGPYAYWQETRLTDIKTLKETEQVIKAVAENLKAENVRLAENVENMTDSVNKLEDVEQALQVITTTQGNAVQALSKQVQETKENLKRMQVNVKGDILRNLLSIFKKIDTDGDQSVSDAEVDACIKRMKNVPGVQVHEEQFRKEFQGGKSTRAVMGIVKNLLKDDLPDQERIFIIQQQ